MEVRWKEIRVVISQYGVKIINKTVYLLESYSVFEFHYWEVGILFAN